MCPGVGPALSLPFHLIWGLGNGGRELRPGVGLAHFLPFYFGLATCGGERRCVRALARLSPFPFTSGYPKSDPNRVNNFS
jgi:hypothetical protein